MHSLFEVNQPKRFITKVNCTPVGPPEGLWQTISAAVVLGHDTVGERCVNNIFIFYF